MNFGNKKYNSKLLLFGEYMIILGAEALALPIQNFSGFLKYEENTKSDNLANLIEFIQERTSIKLNIPKHFNAKNLIFESNIPVGYGVGSSGALTAAVYDSFAVNKKQGLEELRFELANIEHFFHGTSSGIDPLISYLNKVVISKKEGLEILNLEDGMRPILNSFYLIDTKISRKTGPLVQIYKSKLENSAFKGICENELIPLNSQAIESIIQKNINDLKRAMQGIANLQYEYFQEMIPSGYKEIWQKSLENKNVHLKLCGAGGGGFMLAFCAEPKYIQSWAANHNLAPIQIIV
jgi:mevalonate kinase